MYHFNIRGPLIVGVALSGDHVTGPYCFEGRLTASLRKLPAKRAASINGKRALACLHEHVDATRWCTTPLCSVFKTSDE